MESSCPSIKVVIDQAGINWTTWKVDATITPTSAECFPSKDASTYKVVATVKVTSKIDQDIFPFASLSDSIRFQAVTATGVVVGREDVAYRIRRLTRSENVSASFKELSGSEASRITKIVVGWVYE